LIGGKTKATTTDEGRRGEPGPLMEGEAIGARPHPRPLPERGGAGVGEGKKEGVTTGIFQEEGKHVRPIKGGRGIHCWVEKKRGQTKSAKG